MNPLFILLGTLTTTATVTGWWCHNHGTVSEAPAVRVSDDLDVEAELRKGCAHLIELACSSDSNATWAEQELQRAATAPWATPALQAQALAGLARVTAYRQVAAQR